MLLKIGDLAKRTGLTVRTLHHYDELGLLSPSARSDAGYRLYNREDIARLHRILALRQLGLPLAEIGETLASQGSALPALIDRQLQALALQITEAIALRDRLGRLRDVLARGGEPELADWLSTLEQMTVYDKYFTTEEQAELQQRQADPAIATAQQSWPALIAEVRQLMDAGTPVDDPATQDAARRWSALVHQFTGSNPALLIKSALMMRQEPSMQAQTGIAPDMLAYITQALAHARLAIYAHYLNDTEMVRMRAHYGKNPTGWLPLIAEVRRLMNAGATPDSKEVQAAAQQWELLTREFAGEDPATRQKLRTALEEQPALLMRTGVDQAMLAFIQAAGVAGVA
ncbi:MerR family transcriptional regulator [Parachitinimonas caeni]|uniref:MerR family transcriptional regulator n=1 Tax=Parachitinimonas caeni TaxID=3031301 RepID=A0ABT7DRE8_9NEIS|nr:MerR family transcriptional regulator [Parachitinimonas caeni]MDK2122647.1 MerR family transcriptional regulator [Parachitinimonas caeni]